MIKIDHSKQKLKVIIVDIWCGKNLWMHFYSLHFGGQSTQYLLYMLYILYLHELRDLSLKLVMLIITIFLRNRS